MRIRAKVILITFADLPLKAALTASAAVAAFHMWGEDNSFVDVVSLSLASIALHLLIRLQCGFSETVGEDNDVKLLINNAKSEVKYALVVCAAAYFLEPEITQYALVTFLLFNFVLQNIPLLVQQLIRHSDLELEDETSGRPQCGSLESATQAALIYGTGANALSLARALMDNPQSRIRPVGFIDDMREGLWSWHDIPCIGGASSLERYACERQVDYLFMAPEPGEIAQSQRTFAIAEKMGVPTCVLPHIYHTTVSSCQMKSLAGQPALVYTCSKQTELAAVAKRAVDLLGATTGLILTSPILLATAIAIKLTSRGSVLFRQVRVGHNGAPFVALKFRTMVVNAEELKESLRKKNEMSGPVFKIKDDPRITPIGRYLRKFSIDEFPQLFNVLAGDMSLVGPRPAVPSEVASFAPWQRRKLAVKPGCTCIWQVSGRNAVDFEDWMKMDLAYIDQWSLWLDAKILARTGPAVVKGDGC